MFPPHINDDTFHSVTMTSDAAEQHHGENKPSPPIRLLESLACLVASIACKIFLPSLFLSIASAGIGILATSIALKRLSEYNWEVFIAINVSVSELIALYPALPTWLIVSTLALSLLHLGWMPGLVWGSCTAIRLNIEEYKLYQRSHT